MPAQVVQWLLANNYLMTALELLVEAQEVGREDEVEDLNVFFSDREKFPPEELVKFDQNDGGCPCFALHILFCSPEMSLPMPQHACSQICLRNACCAWLGQAQPSGG